MERGRERSSTARELEREFREGFEVGEVVVSPVLLRGGMVVKGGWWVMSWNGGGDGEVWEVRGAKEWMEVGIRKLLVYW